MEAEQDTVLAMFNIPDIEKIKEKYPVLKTKMEELLAESMMKSEQRIYSFISMEAKDRYLLIGNASCYSVGIDEVGLKCYIVTRK